MAVRDIERRFLDDLANDESVAFTAEDRDALIRAGVPVWCIVRCAVDLVRCGMTDPACIGRFTACVLACFGAGGREDVAEGGTTGGGGSS